MLVQMLQRFEARQVQVLLQIKVSSTFQSRYVPTFLLFFPCTMLQKVSKCEVKAKMSFCKFGNLGVHLPLNLVCNQFWKNLNINFRDSEL